MYKQLAITADDIAEVIAFAVTLTTGDLDAIDTAATAITVVGDRYPEAMQRMIDR